MAHSVRIAVDIGGTFTDLQILFEASGVTHAYKTPTTPEDPAQGLVMGIHEAAQRFHFQCREISALMHGTTIATNAVLERRLPAGALITTAGFEDVLEIGRHVRREIYSLKAEERPLLIPRRYRFGVPERMDASGQVQTPLDERALPKLVNQLQRANIQTVAVALLHAYANPSHEQQVAAYLAEHLPHIAVSLSSQVSPEIREFERSSTTVLNALLMPVVGRYLGQLRTRLEAAGIHAPVYLVQSNGGVTTPEMAAEQPARLLLSGPSGGALAAERLSRELNEINLLAADLGGTSFDVSVVHEGRIRRINQGDVDGLPVRLPMVEIRTVGAGGGSIARVESSGRLQVGPESAGAAPGPVCYGRGGTLPTVTDANAVLGRLDPAFFLGGDMALELPAARGVLSTRVAEPLNLAPEMAAEGILRVATARMGTAIRLSLFEKGLDPADFALLSFGGAGGLHAVEVAAELGAPRVVFPRDPGTLSAWGMLFADIVHDLARSHLRPLTVDALGELAEIIQQLRETGEQLLERDSIPARQRTFRLAMDLRYPGQAYELPVQWLQPKPDEMGLEAAIRDFHALHEAQFAHSEADVTPEVVTVRLAAVGRLKRPRSRPYRVAGEVCPEAQRHLYIDGDWREVPVYRREQLPPGGVFPGPALVEEAHSTLFIPPYWQAQVLESGALLARHA